MWGYEQLGSMKNSDCTYYCYSEYVSVKMNGWSSTISYLVCGKISQLGTTWAHALIIMWHITLAVKHGLYTNVHHVVIINTFVMHASIIILKLVVYVVEYC